MCCHSYCCLLYIPGLYNACHIFHRRVRYCALSVLCVRYVRIQRPGIILAAQVTLVSNFVSVMLFITELTRGEKLRTQSITQSLTQLI